MDIQFRVSVKQEFDQLFNRFFTFPIYPIVKNRKLLKSSLWQCCYMSPANNCCYLI